MKRMCVCVCVCVRERDFHPTLIPGSQKGERERQHVSGVTGDNWEKGKEIGG